MHACHLKWLGKVDIMSEIDMRQKASYLLHTPWLSSQLEISQHLPRHMKGDFPHLRAPVISCFH
jgi:hypothetical protein